MPTTPFQATVQHHAGGTVCLTISEDAPAMDRLDPGAAVLVLPDAEYLTLPVGEVRITGAVQAGDEALLHRMAEALRLTAEHQMLPRIAGWSWFDALQEYHDRRGWDRLPADGGPAGTPTSYGPGALPVPPIAHVRANGRTLCGATAPANGEGLLTVPAEMPDLVSCPQCRWALTDADEQEAVWSLRRITDTLADPRTSSDVRRVALRHLTWHTERSEQTTVAADPGPEDPQDVLYRRLHGAREALCSAQTGLSGLVLADPARGGRRPARLRGRRRMPRAVEQAGPGRPPAAP